ncbi:MAG: OadG family protein [Clostridia bacterium]|nr:OadG family protein [Oscillospiraceae bacterium]MDY5626257.1 OadG family protein [Clostridia bacterium]
MVNWGNALLVVVLGLGIVFTVLAIIMFVLIIMEKLLAPKSKKDSITVETTEKEPVIQPQQQTLETQKDDGEIIAAITAAICASFNTSPHNIRIKSYRRLGESASAWNRASRSENIYKGF